MVTAAGSQQGGGSGETLHTTALCLTLLHWVHCAALCCNVLHCAALCCTVLQCAAMCCTVLHCVALCCTVLHSTVLHFTALNFIVLHYMACNIVLCCTVNNRHSDLDHSPSQHACIVYHRHSQPQHQTRVTKTCKLASWAQRMFLLSPEQIYAIWEIYHFGANHALFEVF